jgi:hypothetical protein
VRTGKKKAVNAVVTMTVTRKMTAEISSISQIHARGGAEIRSNIVRGS